MQLSASKLESQSGAMIVSALLSALAIGFALLGTFWPEAAGALVIVTLASALIWRSLNWCSFIVMFLLYSNLITVAVNFHNVPSKAAQAALGLLFIPIAYYVLIKQSGVRVGHALPWILGMAIIQFIGVWCAEQPQRAWDSMVTFMTEAVVLYVLITNAVRSEQALRGVTWSLVLAGILMGGVPLYQQMTKQFDNNFWGLAQIGEDPGFAVDDEEQKRLAGPIGEKNRYAQIMLMIVPLGLFLLRDAKSSVLRLVILSSIILSSAGVFLAFSRSTILCAGMVIALAAWLNHINRKRVMIAFGLATACLLMTPQYQTRLASLVNLKDMLRSGKHSQADGALKGRATEMGAAALVFLDHPLTGVGPGQFKYYSREYGERIGLRALAPERQAHCLPLDVAAENGFFGLVCLLSIFGVLGVKMNRQINEPTTSGMKHLTAGYFYMMMTYAATGLFLHFAFIRYFWLTIALADASLLIAESQKNGGMKSLASSQEHEG